jgi:hypothetical protein
VPPPADSAPARGAHPPADAAPARGPNVPLPRRRAAEHRWPAEPVDAGRPAVEECSDNTLMRIQRALRALR